MDIGKAIGDTITTFGVKSAGDFAQVAADFVFPVCDSWGPDPETFYSHVANQE